MKKIFSLTITVLFLLSNNIQASLFQGPNPYSFGPQGRSVSDLRDFAKPKYMANILAGRPVVATKSDGTRVYYTSDGKLALSIKENGEMTFSLGGYSKSRDKFGNLKAETKTFKGNFQEVKNEFGEIQSYNQLNGSGKVIASYDKDMNKTASYYYDKFGKGLEYSVNEMTKQKTVYDKYERAMAVYDPDGFILTSYQYEDVSYESSNDRKTLVTEKKDSKGNGFLVTTKSYVNRLAGGIDSNNDNNVDYSMAYSTTFYDEKGLITHVTDANNFTTMIYSYKKDKDGNKVLDYVVDILNKHKTYYENNKQIYTISEENNAFLTRYFWNGSKFLFSAQVDLDGKLTVTDSDGVTTNSNVVYNEDGTIKFVITDDGTKILEKYFYKKDSDGNSILDYIENEDGSKTYYDENGQSVKTVNTKGEIIKDYGWNKSNLVYSFDRQTGITTWYIPGEENNPVIAYESLNDRIISKNIYSYGQLIGKWTVGHSHEGAHPDAEAKDVYSLTIYVNERQEFELIFEEEPTVEQISYIKDMYVKTGSLNFLKEFFGDHSIKDVRFTNTDVS